MKIKRLIFYLIFLLCVALIFIFFLFRGSLPTLSGTISVQGLSEDVYITRDQYSVPTIVTKNRTDAAFATGFLHAQERFFQMDLMRRMAAGELAELFGEIALEHDKEKRLHRFRQQSRKTYALLSSNEQELLKAYAQGVNAGLNIQSARPFEYYILNVRPVPWKEEDSILVGMSLFFELQDPLGELERTRGVLKAHLPSQVYAFFTQNNSIWDAPIDSSPKQLIDIPPKKCFSYLQKSKDLHVSQSNEFALPRSKGSNQWAVGPICTEEKIPFLACDMHLNLSVPNIWYRASLDYETAENDRVKVHGITLPGTPLVAVGTNEHIAWGFTNGYINTTDLIILEKDPAQQFDYLTYEGPQNFEEITEQIFVKGASPVDHKIQWSQWGPVDPEKFLGKNVAIKWIAHHPCSFNFLLVNLETAHTVSETLESHAAIRLPVLNLMLVDSKGHLGWSYLGSIPKRTHLAPETPVSSLMKNPTWNQFWEQKDFLQIIDPPSGRLWTANNRVLDAPLLGNDYLNSIRAYQIKERLFASNSHTAESMLAIQLDDEAFFFDRWYNLLNDSLNPNLATHAQLQSTLGNWDHHCHADSKGYFWIKKFREQTMNRVLRHFLSPCLIAYPKLQLGLLDFEEPVFLIISKQPSYLPPPTCPSWNAELQDVINEMLKENASQFSAKKQNWGNTNQSQIKHPLGDSLFFLNPIINMKSKPLSGDYYVPRLASPNEGASMRIIISPGYEAQGLFNMPCGQSGHPLSKHYKDQHASWLQGQAMSLLPKEAKYQLKLISPRG